METPICPLFIVIRLFIFDSDGIGTAALPASWWCWPEDNAKSFCRISIKFVKMKALERGTSVVFVHFDSCASCLNRWMVIFVPYIHWLSSTKAFLSTKATILSSQPSTELNLCLFGHFYSTWTIDLCYLLRRFGIQHIYTTVTVGVNPSFRSHNYYGAILWRDHVRVSTKFDSAVSDGLTIQKKTVDNRVLLEHLAYQGPVIVLTNGYLLHCDLCHSTNSPFTDEVKWVVNNFDEFQIWFTERTSNSNNSVINFKMQEQQTHHNLSQNLVLKTFQCTIFAGNVSQ